LSSTPHLNSNAPSLVVYTAFISAYCIKHCTSSP